MPLVFERSLSELTDFGRRSIIKIVCSILWHHSALIKFVSTLRTAEISIDLCPNFRMSPCRATEVGPPFIVRASTARRRWRSCCWRIGQSMSQTTMAWALARLPSSCENGRCFGVNDTTKGFRCGKTVLSLCVCVFIHVW